MYRYGSTRSPVTDKTPAISTTRAYNNSNYNTRNILKNSAFQEGRMLSLILRATFHRVIKYSFNLIKSQPKITHNKLKIIQRMQYRLLKTIFVQISIYGQRRLLSSNRKKVETVNINFIACTIICSVYHSKIREAVYKIQRYKGFLKMRDQQFQRVLNILQGLLLKMSGKPAFRRLIMKKQQNQSLKHKIKQFSNIYKRIEEKKMSQATQIIILALTEKQKKQLMKQFQEKKKYVNYSQNQRNVILANQRRNLQQLKKNIDANAVQKYQMMGEMKRGKAIRVGQQRSAIRSLEQQVTLLAFQSQKNIKIVQNLSMIKQQRQTLQISAKKGKGAEQRISQLYVTLKNQVQRSSPTCRSISSSKFITMIKEKFKQTLSPASNPEMVIFKNCVGYCIYLNAKNRNLVNLYENVPMETLKISEAYQRASEENIALKELFGSLVSYRLYALSEDRQLQNDMADLESQVHQMLDNEAGEKGEPESATIRDSVLSYTNKSIERKKEFGKASTMSVRTTR